MKRYIKGLYMSFGMFCSIPQPFHLWDEKAVNLVLPFFPLVGGFIGALWLGVIKILMLCGLHAMPLSAAAALFPFIISGFLHLDGYMDTCDAVLSRRPIEDKLRILKDPHSGAFAVIMLAVLFIIQFAVIFAAMDVDDGKNLTPLAVIPVLSRCCAAFSILCLKPLAQSSYAKLFRQNAKASHKKFVVVIAIFGITLAFFLAGIGGLLVSLSAMAAFVAAMTWAYRDLKGVSGDVAGFALVVSEVCALAVMAAI